MPWRTMLVKLEMDVEKSKVKQQSFQEQKAKESRKPSQTVES